MISRVPYTPIATDYAYGQVIPQGMTCNDCTGFRRCAALFGHVAADRVCDWSPHRFQAKSAGRFQAEDKAA
jgi:hypothetical protein